MFKCMESLCGSSFPQEHIFKKHFWTHTEEKPYSCGAAFPTNMQTHTGEKPFYCEACGCSFSDCSSWKVHSQRHEEEKTFPSKSFDPKLAANSNLRKHRKLDADRKSVV